MKNNHKLIEKFNEMFPVGSTVGFRFIARDDMSGFRRFKVRSKAFDRGGQPVAFLEGITGCVSIEKQFIDYSDKTK